QYLSAPPGSGFGPEEITAHPDDEQSDERQADELEVVLEVGDRLVAVPNGQQAFAKVPDAAADPYRKDEAGNGNAGHAGKQDEDLEWRGRRKQRGNQHRQDAVSLNHPERSIHTVGVEAAAYQRVAALETDVVQHDAAG